METAIIALSIACVIAIFTICVLADKLIKANRREVSEFYNRLSKEEEINVLHGIINNMRSEQIKYPKMFEDN